MLFQTLYLLTAILFTSTAALEGNLLFAKTAFAQSQTDLLEAASGEIVGNLEDLLANTVKNGGAPDPSSLTFPIDIWEERDSVWVHKHVGAPSPGPDSAIVPANQGAHLIREGRFAISSVAEVWSADRRTLLGSRAMAMTFRLFAQAPYVAVSGLKAAAGGVLTDLSLDDAHEGDVGGQTFPAGGDTAVHLDLHCDRGGCAQAALDRHALYDHELQPLRWRNGNANVTNWNK